MKARKHLVEFTFENERFGYVAELLLTVSVLPAERGEYDTPPEPAEVELLAVDARSVAIANNRHTFGPSRHGAENSLRRLLRQIVESGFYCEYETDNRLRELVTEAALDEADDAAEWAAECAAETRRQAAERF